MKQKIAIIGADINQKLLIEKAKQMGIYTICFGLKESSACKDICDEFHNISIIKSEEIYKVCKGLNIDGVISVGIDITVSTVNYVAERLGLVGNSMETVMYSTNKIKMRDQLQQSNLPIPKYIIGNSIGEKHGLNFPFMVKAAQSSGSKGVTLVNNELEYESAYKDAMNYSKEVILEEYFEGRQFSVEMISENGEHHFIGLTEEFYSGVPYFVEKDYIIPGKLKDDLLKRLIELVSNSLDAINFKNGASHTEVRINNSDEFCIIEIAGRMGGFRAEFIELGYGIDYNNILIDIVLGRGFNLDIKKPISPFTYMKWVKNERDLELMKSLLQNEEIDYYQFYEERDRKAKITDITKNWAYFIKRESSYKKCLEYINYK